MKIAKLILAIVVSIVSIATIFISEKMGWNAANSICSISGVVLGLFLPIVCHLIQDLSDNTNWKDSQRKLQRGNFVKEDTIIRISFAYLFRIKIGNTYLLVKNERGTGKYQPVGGVYKLKGNEKKELKNRYHIIDDNKIPIDISSRDDYRLRLENKYLRKFMRRFDKRADRERIDDLSREFREELIEPGILDWKQISYRCCGRHITELQFGDHFQVYELLLADVVELIPTTEQERDLLCLMNSPSPKYFFATTEEINSLGVNTETGNLLESIGDHTKKTIQENEGKLEKISCVGNIYSVSLE